MFDQDWGPMNDSADRWIDEWSGNIAAQAERARALSQQVAELSVTASSEDGLVDVTVGGSGLVTDIRLADRVTARQASSIAADILRVMHKAQVELGTRVAEAVADTVGTDSPAGKAVIDGFTRRFPVQSDQDNGEPWSGRDRRR